MANRLKMAVHDAILQLHKLQWPARRIARELGIDRGTVARHVRRQNGLPQNAPEGVVPTGSEGSNAATFPGVPGPRVGTADIPCPTATEPDPKAAISPAGSERGIRVTTAATGPAEQPAADGSDAGGIGSGSPSGIGRPSLCEPFREVIVEKLGHELTAQRIYQDLAADHGYRGGYDSVKRFVRRLAKAGAPLPMRRMECPPGFEAQVDYGTGAAVIGIDGKRRKTNVFRIVLSHSRKGYSEASFRQTTDDFLCALENAFWYFGGVPQTIVIDNLKAAVKHADWYDPELQPKLQSFCAHYGTAILPARPYTPRHKGKIERGIGYVKGNSLKGKTFSSLDEQNRHLADWEKTVADTRIHGTTRRHVGQVFEAIERQALRALPVERFAFFHEAQRIVSRDGHVEVAKAFYSAPPEYLARTVWVRWDARLVRIFNQRMEQIAMHVRHEPGRFSTQPAHIAAEKIGGIERGAQWLMNRITLIGPSTTAWAEAMLTARGIEGTRVLMGVIALTKRHSSAVLENACKTALSHGAFRLRDVSEVLARQPHVAQSALPFLDEHPLIRPLDDYAQVVAAALERKGAAQNAVSGGDPSNDRKVRFERHDWANECPGRQPESPGGNDRQGLRDIHPPRSGYSSPGCSPAEPGSASPDSSSLRSLFPPLPGESSDE